MVNQEFVFGDVGIGVEVYEGLCDCKQSWNAINVCVGFDVAIT